eukprot:TRINITY_DN16751_c2_g1_i1.p1 TRINITY_DN16751_c2_g1~~TRINITY_DN16751_c2_g1_i1.p1  ORF type:complete len:108 (-),score=18.51 TRINITY_DN16751_c2_g1_i1:55-378(-)
MFAEEIGMYLLLVGFFNRLDPLVGQTRNQSQLRLKTCGTCHRIACGDLLLLLALCRKERKRKGFCFPFLVLSQLHNLRESISRALQARWWQLARCTNAEKHLRTRKL